MENKETFQYTYSAKQQEEIKNIRKKYAAQEEDKMEQLRKLDQSVTQKATTGALIVGILGALILGFGMSLSMTNLNEILGSAKVFGILIGSIIGGVGIVLVCFAYPLYNRILRKERERIAPEILRLSDELLK